MIDEKTESFSRAGSETILGQMIGNVQKMVVVVVVLLNS